MSIYKLYATATGDGSASLDIVQNGNIEAIAWHVDYDCVADNQLLRAEVSFASSSGLATNDTKSSISAFRAYSNLGAAGADFGTANYVIAPVDIPVSQGERMYLHLSHTMTAVAVTVYLYVDDKIGSQGRRVRQ